MIGLQYDKKVRASTMVGKSIKISDYLSENYKK